MKYFFVGFATSWNRMTEYNERSVQIDGRDQDLWLREPDFRQAGESD